VRIRVVPTASGKYAVQVVSKRYGIVTVHKHIGTFSDVSGKSQLYKKAKEFIAEATHQGNLLDLLSSCRPADVVITESRPLLVYQLLSAIYDKLGLNTYPDLLIKDLVIARIYSPASKRETREILADLFNRQWSLITIYRHLKKGIDTGLKDVFQKALIDFARDDLQDSLHLIFYDVTTLYFESTARDGIRDFGFSKDHRTQETQIVVGLVVNQQGFPLYFDVFRGRTFEGHTLCSVVKNIQKLLGSPDLVVVADAAMLSQENIDQLIRENISFIVGARIGNLSSQMIDQIASQLNGQDGKTITVTYRKQRLVCQYLRQRAAKDRSDREKQIARAQEIINAPKVKMRRYRFIKTAGETITLNVDLVTKAEKLEGIKGYITNTQLPDAKVIERYHDLWRIEYAFRLTKSDLEARPIFHRLDETIQAHLVIVFAGLAICKYIENKSGMSIQKVLKLAGKVLTHKVTNIKTGECAYIQTTIEDPSIKEKIDFLESLGH
jgi:transposase